MRRQKHVAPLALVGAFLASLAPGQSCRDLITDPPSGERRLVLWLSEDALAGQAEAGCGSLDNLVANIKRNMRPQVRCSSVPTDGGAFDPTGRVPPNAPPELSVEAVIARQDIVILGVVDELRPGIDPSSGLVSTIVRVQITEPLRTAGWDGEGGNIASFRRLGGQLKVGDQVRCTDIPSMELDWHPGDHVLLAGGIARTSEPSYVGSLGTAFRVVEDRVIPPVGAPWTAASPTLDEIRQALAARPR